MNNFQNQHLNNQQNQQQTSFQGQPNAQTQQQPSIIMKLVGSCLPVLLEQFAGQSLPQMGGNAMETQLVLSQVLTLQQQIITNQQALDQRLVQLETNASQQFLGLAQEVKSIKSIRLSHERESKRIEFTDNDNGFNKSQHYNSQQQQEN
jgi:hypothetical protein